MGEFVNIWLNKGASSVMQTSHGFFSSPGGIIVLSVCATLAGASALAVLRKLPKVFDQLRDIRRALVGEPAQPEYGITEQKGLIKQVDEIRVRQDRSEDHITEEINSLNRNLSEIRSHLRMKPHEYD